jgi:hypothetical protein
MAQNYLWKVTYEEDVEIDRPRGGDYYWIIDVIHHTEYRSKVFASKLEAMRFVNKLENNDRYSDIRMKKWFG